MNVPQGKDFLPSWLLRNGHVQTVLSSSGPRRWVLAKTARALRRGEEPVTLDAGDGVRLTGAYTSHQTAPQPTDSSQPTGAPARGLAVLFHGWEGSVDSSYVLQTGARLLREGWDVFRLNFRDHGDSHCLNEALFHSCRMDEVMRALGDIARRYRSRPMVLAGFSLGGNFALRVALCAPAAGVPLSYALAVCPIIDPSEGLFALEESAPWFYQAYFLRKWRHSLKIKQAAFPNRHYFELSELKQDLRGLTAALVARHTDFDSLQAYLDGYSIAGSVLAQMRIPATILTARDDPVIPIHAFEQLQLPAHVELDIAPYGGHCGFLRGWNMGSFTDDYIAARFNAVADDAVGRQGEGLPANAP